MTRWIAVLFLLAACYHGSTTTVIESRVNIPAHAQLDPFITHGTFVPVEIPRDQVQERTVTSLDQLAHQNTLFPLRANEPITEDQLGVP